MEIKKKDWQRYVARHSAINKTAADKMKAVIEADTTENIGKYFGPIADESHWVVYRLEERNGKITKVPVNPKTGRNAKSNDKKTWGTLKEAQEAVKKYNASGVGFMLGDGYFGIDIDHCINPKSGRIAGYAQDIIDTMASYTEISPSGTGIHIIAKGTPDLPIKRNDAIEMYNGGRYFTVTGQSYGPAIPISTRTAEAGTVWAKYVKGKPKLPDGVVPLQTATIIDHAYALATKYGEAAAALSCEMYDAVALAEGAAVPAAVPAATATYHETAKAVNGTLKTQSLDAIPSVVERLTKAAGADTIMQNAIRDGAEWAWIPSGDSCAFCQILASQGWQKASKSQLDGGHAEHIHAHCDCTFAIRFGDLDIPGYDPDEYLRRYENADSGKWKAKMNAMRREQYAENRDEINARKRENYEQRKQLEKEKEDKNV